MAARDSINARIGNAVLRQAAATVCCLGLAAGTAAAADVPPDVARAAQASRGNAQRTPIAAPPAVAPLAARSATRPAADSETEDLTEARRKYVQLSRLLPGLERDFEQRGAAVVAELDAELRRIELATTRPATRPTSRPAEPPPDPSAVVTGPATRPGASAAAAAAAAGPAFGSPVQRPPAVALTQVVQVPHKDVSAVAAGLEAEAARLRAVVAAARNGPTVAMDAAAHARFRTLAAAVRSFQNDPAGDAARPAAGAAPRNPAASR